MPGRLALSEPGGNGQGPLPPLSKEPSSLPPLETSKTSPRQEDGVKSDTEDVATGEDPDEFGYNDIPGKRSALAAWRGVAAARLRCCVWPPFCPTPSLYSPTHVNLSRCLCTCVWRGVAWRGVAWPWFVQTTMATPTRARKPQ